MSVKTPPLSVNEIRQHVVLRVCKKSLRFHQGEFPFANHLTDDRKQRSNVIIWCVFAHLPVSMNHSLAKSLLSFHVTYYYCHFSAG